MIRFYEDDGNPLIKILKNAAKYANLADCLKDEVDMVGPGVFAKFTINTINEKVEVNFYFKGEHLTREQWLNRKFNMRDHPRYNLVKVDEQFWSQWESSADKIREKLNQVTKELEKESINDYVLNLIGHGIGGVHAILTAAALCEAQDSDIINVFTFGQPRIGDQVFAYYMNMLQIDEDLDLRIFRITNSDDYVPRLPFYPSIRAVHHALEIWIPPDIPSECECPEGKIFYVCIGPIENENEGIMEESRQCNNKYEQTQLGTDSTHFGPYFGYFMGGSC
ncbi:hypothetical protein G9A89_020134 [Geosiphon pyriformis]|nr:hypothetical protein G9A89_020134 [Geosiphon pyriformis]